MRRSVWNIVLAIPTVLVVFAFILDVAEWPNKLATWGTWLAPVSSAALRPIVALLSSATVRFVIIVIAAALFAWVNHWFGYLKTGYSLSAGSYRVPDWSSTTFTAFMPSGSDQLRISIPHVNPNRAAVEWEPQSDYTLKIVDGGSAVQISRTRRTGWFWRWFGRPDLLRVTVHERTAGDANR